ncbi:MAG: hypothetical protein ACRDAM_21990 [Casimicrobium sp.]
MPNFVQVYKSTDAGAPTLTGQSSKLVDLLKTVLVNGYPTTSVSSMTRTGSIVTVTLAAANSTIVTGEHRTIAGAAETDYNGTWPVTVISSTQYSFNVGAATPASPATGTLTERKASLNWSNPFNGTNAAVFRSQNTASPQHYLQVIDNGATSGGAREVQVYAFETMSANDTGTNRFPSVAQQGANGLCWMKSSSLDAVARAWTIIGDDKAFYLQTNANNSDGTTNLYGFGCFPSYKVGDAYNTFIAGQAFFNSTSPNVTGVNVNTQFVANNATLAGNGGLFLARPFSQVGSSVGACTVAAMGNLSSGSPFGANITGTNACAYPEPVTSGAVVYPVLIVESSAIGNPIRGRLPGFFPPFHRAPFTNYDEITGITGLGSAALVVLTMQSQSSNIGQVGIDRVGPW